MRFWRIPAFWRFTGPALWVGKDYPQGLAP